MQRGALLPAVSVAATVFFRGRACFDSNSTDNGVFDTSRQRGDAGTMSLSLLQGLVPFRPREAVNDALAGLVLASMNVPQVLGYTRIAGTPVVTGLYTVLLPLVGFALFGWPSKRFSTSLQRELLKPDNFPP
jgi:MFS superfamily sulfate permease-like transporter